MPRRFKIVARLASVAGLLVVLGAGVLLFRLLGEIEAAPPGELPEGWQGWILIYVALAGGGVVLLAAGHAVELLLRLLEVLDRKTAPEA